MTVSEPLAELQSAVGIEDPGKAIVALRAAIDGLAIPAHLPYSYTIVLTPPHPPIWPINAVDFVVRMTGIPREQAVRVVSFAAQKIAVNAAAAISSPAAPGI